MSCVYVVDFGRFRKVGMSKNFESRVKEISKRLKLKPVRTEVIDDEGIKGVESRVKKSLYHHLIDDAYYPTETFGCSFSTCVNAIHEAKDFILSSVVKRKRGASKLDHSERNSYIHIGITNGTLIELDAHGDNRSALIETAVKSHYKIGDL